MRIAVVYNTSPKSRHQRMWVGAMNPSAVRASLSRKNNPGNATQPYCCDGSLIALLSLTEQTRRICSQ